MRIAAYAFEPLLPETGNAPAAAGVAAKPAVESAPPPPPPPSFSEAELASAKAAAYEEGFLAGKKEGRREVDHESLQIQQDANKLTATITARIEALAQEHRDYLAARQPDLGRLVLGCGQKLAVEALRKEPLADIEAMIRDCLGLLMEAPEVRVEVHPRLQPQLARQFQGQAKVVATPEMNPLDCRVSWQYGEAVRDIDAIWHQIEQTIDRYFTISATELTASPEGESQHG